MSEDNLNRPSGEPEEEMSVELELEDGTLVNCAVITILDVAEKSYIVLLPLNENGQNEDGEVWFYGYSERKMIPMQNLNCVSLRMTMSMKWLLMHSTNIWTVVSLMN